MNAKKPLLLTVLILALFVVALIVPTTVSGTSDNKPVAEVSFGHNSGPMALAPGVVVQIGVTLQVQVRQVLDDDGELVDESIGGHMVNLTIKNPLMPRSIATNGSGNTLLWATFGDFDGDGLDEAEVGWLMWARQWPLDGPGAPQPLEYPYIFRFWLEDGGEPALGADSFEAFYWDGSDWVSISGGHVFPTSNIQIHITDAYVPSF